MPNEAGQKAEYRTKNNDNAVDPQVTRETIAAIDAIAPGCYCPQTEAEAHGQTFHPVDTVAPDDDSDNMDDWEPTDAQLQALEALGF